MKIGVKLPNSGPFATASYIRQAALECDRLGYDSLWCHDHLHRTVADVESHFVAGSVKAWETWDGPILPNVFESVSTLFYVAGITENIQLGTSIIVLPLRHPVWLAKYWACLDHFCGGRAIVGIGSGGGAYIEDELNAAGHPEWVQPRGKVVDEWVAIMRKVWQDDVVDHDGEFLTIKGATVFPKPVQRRMPIWFGGYSKRVIRRIARDLDGWLPMFYSPQVVREGGDRIRAAAAEFGRDPAEITVASEHWMTIGSDHDAAVRRAQEAGETLWGYTTRWDTPEAKWFKEHGDYNLAGSPEAILELLDEYRDAGVEHVILRVIADDFSEMLEQLNMFKESVMDKLSDGRQAAA
jgi:probable F420-dependent oxidoreductase